MKVQKKISGPPKVAISPEHAEHLERLSWVHWIFGQFSSETAGQSAANVGKKIRRMELAFSRRELGLDPLADKMMRYSLAEMAERSVHGKKAADARWREKRADARGCSGIPENANRREEEKKRYKTRNPKKAAGSDSDSVDKSSLGSEQPEAEKDAAWTVENPWQFAAQYCGQGKDRFTRNTFQKSYREVGDHAFREELHAFMAEIKEGEQVAHRGKAFTARLTKLREQVRVRKACHESLAASAPGFSGDGNENNGGASARPQRNEA